MGLATDCCNLSKYRPISRVIEAVCVTLQVFTPQIWAYSSHKQMLSPCLAMGPVGVVKSFFLLLTLHMIVMMIYTQQANIAAQPANVLQHMPVDHACPLS